MDKYLTFPGRQPVYLGDIDFMQDAVRDTFAQLLKGYTGLATPTAILHGVVVTSAPDSISWTPLSPVRSNWSDSYSACTSGRA